MIKRGFDQTATKDDVARLTQQVDGLEQKMDGLEGKTDSLAQKTMSLEQRMEDGFRAVNRRLDLIHDDISDLPDIREEVQAHDVRIARLERKAGIAK